MKFETIIGLEVHVELLTTTKLFCACPNRFGAPPNSLVCSVCLGLPGTLPVVNEEALNQHLKAASALCCEIAGFSKFDRKNYFYPDMPKNYQISQYDLPLASKGFLEIEDSSKNKKIIRIRRIHVEEDTGKLIHIGKSDSIASADYTLVDYNRAGVPLLEIVSEPDMRTPEEAFCYLTQLKKILNWLEVSDCKMEEGSLRCDANISLRPEGSTEMGTKCEIKNMNSFKAVRSALVFEEKRHKDLLERGESIIQETRGWEETRGITISLRGKEEAHDYRYFPEPDLPPLKISQEWIARIRNSLPEMPTKMAERFVKEYGIPEYDACVLTGYRAFADFFEKTIAYCNDAKLVSNWMMSDILKYLNANELEIQNTKITPDALGKMINLIKEEIISGKIAKNLVEELMKNGGKPEKIIREKNWMQITSRDELMPIILESIEKNPKVLKLYLGGKETAREFFIGQVMKTTRGKASPKALNILLDEELKRRKNSKSGFNPESIVGE